MSHDKLRERALEEALRDPEGQLQRLRAEDRALTRIHARSKRRARTLGALGIAGQAGGATLAVLGAAALIATPLGWALAAGSAVLGLGALVGAAGARRKAQAAAARKNRMRLGPAGSALEVDAVLARFDTLRAAVAADYARYERRVLAEVDVRRHRDNAALLQDLRGRQLAHVARLDAARAAAVALRGRLVERAVSEAVDARIERVEPARAAWSESRARAVFERDDLSQEVERLRDEAEALEALERELA
ncbi:MAG: hypothetical protein JNJ59_19515 [Deltaproteobacteria bacterium]|jgi:hypothetical protein|nr:hypothetical protein [Deltaproteobacteria bacterium]